MQPRDNAIVIPRHALRRVVAGVLAAVVVLVLLVLLFQQRDRLGLERGIGDQIDRNAMQAVFLTGGQVYFGRLAAQGDYFTLADVFYLANASETLDPRNPGQLVKRGSELHGPRDPMLIPRDKVLFVENMRDDSEVVAAIRQFRAGGAAPRTPAPTVAPPASPTATPRPSPSPTR